MRLQRMFALGLALALGVATAAEATIRVGSIAKARFVANWTLDGTEMESTRAKLLNAANFGAAGTVANPITITDTAAPIDAALLADFDTFFIGYLADASANAFTPAELAAFQKWVYEGGTMIVTCDDTTHDAVCAYFGHPSAGTQSTNPVTPTPVAESHPLFNGPFGAVTTVVMSGTRGAITATTGATVLADDNSVGKLPVILVRQFGLGKVVFLADVDIISDRTLSAGAAVSNQNDRFLANLFAFITSITPQVGLWYNPLEDGSGYAIDAKHNVIVVTTYSYKPGGDWEWYISSGPLIGNDFTGELFKARNGQCISCPYPGPPVLGGSDGAITIQFLSPTSAIAYLPGGRVVPIQPQAF